MQKPLCKVYLFNIMYPNKYLQAHMHTYYTLHSKTPTHTPHTLSLTQIYIYVDTHPHTPALKTDTALDLRFPNCPVTIHW